MAQAVNLTHDDFIENVEYKILSKMYGAEEAKKMLSEDAECPISDEEIRADLQGWDVE